MEIILLERIQNLGDLGELVNVKPGYARNFLLPQKKAMRATEDAKEEVEKRRRELAEHEAKRLDGARARADLAITAISVTRLAGEEGHLFGSVTQADIAEAMTEAGTEIAKSEVHLPEGPIKEVGESEAEVILHPEVRFTVKVVVVGEEAPEEMRQEPEAVEEPEDV
ncbi:MAG: 50S ribosomal protein L9 [Pseudomonadota bacterium]|nr:50S ribosomal protein L9 [Pseudomonadota bacterium]